MIKEVSRQRLNIAVIEFEQLQPSTAGDELQLLVARREEAFQRRNRHQPIRQVGQKVGLGDHHLNLRQFLQPLGKVVIAALSHVHLLEIDQMRDVGDVQDLVAVQVQPF